MSPFGAEERSWTRFANRWVRLGDPAPDTLRDARDQLHRALQPLAAFGEAFVASLPDHGHVSVGWSPERRAFLTGEDQGTGIRVGLHPGNLTYRIFGPGVLRSQPFQLRGRTMAEASAWLESELSSRMDGTPVSLRIDASDIPRHRVGRGDTFDAALAEVSEVERWFHDASLLLEAVASSEEGASAVRCWPHHFDIAVLIDLDADTHPSPAPEDARSIGVGMTPGDESYGEPYWYVAPWPYPDPSDLPDLPPPATWHTTNWVGAVLTGSDLVGTGDEAAQVGRVASFVRAGIAAGRGLLRR